MRWLGAQARVLATLGATGAAAAGSWYASQTCATHGALHPMVPTLATMQAHCTHACGLCTPEYERASARRDTSREARMSLCDPGLNNPSAFALLYKHQHLTQPRFISTKAAYQKLSDRNRLLSDCSDTLCDGCSNTQRRHSASYRTKTIETNKADPSTPYRPNH